MEEMARWMQRLQKYATKRTGEIAENLGKNRLWQRQLKNVLATTIVVSICLIPRCSAVLGNAAYLGAITTVFAHPGRRFGELLEALTLALSGTTLGVSWSLLGLYLSSLVIRYNPPAAYSVRGIFLACALLFHGFLRSKTPRLFIFVLLLVIVSVVSLTSVATAVTIVSATQIAYPVLVASGAILLVNLAVFPEFSASFLGQTTIETLYDAAEALGDAGQYFTQVARPAGGLGRLSSPKEDAKTESHSNEAENRDQKPFASIVLEKIRRLKDGKTDSDAGSKPPTRITLQELVGAKTRLRSNLARCKKAQSECNFEIAFAVLPPRELKPISSKMMRRLVANAVAVIGACESKFSLLGESDPQEKHIHETFNQSQPEIAPRHHAVDHLRDRREPKATKGDVVALKDAALPEENILKDEKTNLDLVKPRREIEFGDVKLLQHLLQRIAAPYTMLSTVIARAIDCVTVSIAYSYDVPKFTSGAKPQRRLCIEDVDRYTDELGQALLSFDIDIAEALEGAVDLQESNEKPMDIMPRGEVFLVASFVLNLRQAATHIEEMLKHSRSLVLQRQSRHDRRRFYAPRFKWSKWLNSGGEENEAMPATDQKSNRKGENDGKVDDKDDTYHTGSKYDLIAASDREADLETGRSSGIKLDKFAGPYSQTTSHQGQTLRIRGALADSLEWAQNSDDLLYAFKLAVAVFVVTWPSFVAPWNTWYSLNRGVLNKFAVWAALQLVFITEVSIGNSVMTFLLRGIGTTFGCFWGWAALEARSGNRVVVAAMVCVGLIPSTYVQLGSKYPKAGMVCIVSICVVALSTELQTVPGSATENFLKRWLAFFIGGVVALGIEVGFLPVKARTRLVESLASTIRRVREMETCICTGIDGGGNPNVFDPKRVKRFERASRKANTALAAAETFSYGSGPLEEFNAQLYWYRRNLAGTITLTLFAVETSLITKASLPQFFPSARLSHLRMINRVRAVVQQAVEQDPDAKASDAVRKRAVRRKYMAWNAASAAQAEIIEYLEELVDLAKLVVGANEFRSGLLMRATYQDYTQKLAEVAGKSNESDDPVDMAGDARDNFLDQPTHPTGMVRRRRLTTIQSSGSSEEKIPASLKRIQSRKIEAGLRRQATNEGWT
ncbi:MAG: hypothetical protein Q9173_005398 [Seirophora scorigena]